MAVKKKAKSAAPAVKPAPKTKKADAASKNPAAKSKTASTKTVKSAAKTAAPAKKRATPAKKAPAKAKAPAARAKKRAAKAEPEAAFHIGEPVLDPIGDVSSGEGHAYLGGVEDATHTEAEVANAEAPELEAGPGLAAAARTSLEEDADAASAATEHAPEEEEAEADAKPLPPPRLERLQKILSQAGIASRRRAEEMIVAGRVMVNGQVVTQLGSKADLGRDHIRVDGKLLHGAERHRYFMLNKPRGYVTTVSDPEGRPTVMEFFAKSRERVYPVGRLDYLSEGLLLMTNDGELANLLSKAGSGVEKTYLVKVAGKPTAEELERLRGGVTIEKGEPGSARVRTAPARVREFREGDNPWFEVVLIEGRNRELRKMFAAIGHFAEKIRRVGYGPLVLDVEPGNLRELTEDEVNALRLTAEGKMKPRRIKVEKMLPKEAGVAAEKRDQPRDRKFDRRPDRRFDSRPGARFDRPPGRPGRSDRRPEIPGARSEKPRWKQEERGPKREWQPRSEGFRGEPKARPEFRPSPRQERGDKPFGSAPRGQFKARGERPESRPGPRQERGENRFGSAPRPPFKPRSDRPEFRPGPRQERGENRFGSAPRPPFKPRSDRPEFRPGPRQERGENRFGSAQRPPFKPRGERPEFRGAPRQERGENRFGSAPRPPFKPRGDRPEFRPGPRQARGEKPFGSAPRGSFKPRGDRPIGGAQRGSFKPHGERPEFRPGPRQERGEARPRLEVERVSDFQKGPRSGGSKPKPSFGGKPAFRGKPGGFGKSRGPGGGGAKRGFSRPGAQRGGWKRG
jgi:23S rRNA pseudouridine2605 synthase